MALVDVFICHYSAMSITKRAALMTITALALSACANTAEPELAIMGATPTALPTWTVGADSLPDNNLTHVGTKERLDVFASRNDDDQWCVVLIIAASPEGEDGSSASACKGSADFAEGGAATSVAGANPGGAWLLPDGFSGELLEGWERVNDNLAVQI